MPLTNPGGACSAPGLSMVQASPGPAAWGEGRLRGKAWALASGKVKLCFPSSDRVCMAGVERSDPLGAVGFSQNVCLLSTYLVAGALLGADESNKGLPWAGGSLGAKGTLKTCLWARKRKTPCRILKPLC